MKSEMKIIDSISLDEVSRQAKLSERLRMDYDFHQFYYMKFSDEDMTKLEAHFVKA